MSPAPRHHQKYWARDREGQVLRAVRTLAQAFGAGYRRRDWHGSSWQNSPRWRPGQRREPCGSQTRRQEDSLGTREPGYWRPVPPWKSGGDANGSAPPCNTPATGDVIRCRGEARQLPRSWCPGGTDRWCGMRGGLVGAIPEALCGRPERSAGDQQRTPRDRVEDPQGHPMIHGCRRPHSARTRGKPKERREESDPLSSLLTRMGVRRAVDRSRDNPHGEPAASGKT